jgi:hemolysin III
VTKARPLLRGVLHQWAFVVAVIGGVALICLAEGFTARLSAAVYAGSLWACLGISALYHRGRWSLHVRAWLCRLDHATIFALIAGTMTPIVALVAPSPDRPWLLALVWGGAGVGAGLAFAWPEPPGVVEVGPYLLLGGLGIVLIPRVAAVDRADAVLLVLGGIVYIIGALIYANHRPDPWPRVFGYHELFHALVVVAAGTHYLVVAAVVAPSF